MARRELDALLSLQKFVAGVLDEPWDVRRDVETGREPVRPYVLVEQNGPASADGSKNLQTLTVAYTINAYLPSADSRSAAEDAAMGVREQMFAAVKWGADLSNPTPDRIPLYCYLDRPTVQRVSVRGATAGTWALAGVGEASTGAIAFDADDTGVQAALDAAAPGQAIAERRATGIFDIHLVGDLSGSDVPLMTLDATHLVGGARDVALVLRGAPAPWRNRPDFIRVESFGQTTIKDPDDPALMQVAVDLRCTFARGLPLPFGQMLLQRICATNGNGGL